MANTIDTYGDIPTFTDIVEKDITEFIDDTINEIHQYAFYRCSQLSYISLAAASGVYMNAFGYCSGLVQISLPSLSSLGASAFVSCTSLAQIDLPVRVIASTAFGYCTALSQVSLPNAEVIQDNAFRSCTSLTQIYLPNVNSIAMSAFQDCINLPCASLPSIGSINAYAFSGCSKLSQIYVLASTLCTLGNGALTNTPMANSTYLGYFGSIYVPMSLVDSYKSANRWSGYSNRITAYTG